MSGSETSSENDSIKESVIKAKAVLGKSNETEFRYKRVGKLIAYVTTRIDYYENSRSRIFAASATLLGFGVTMLTFGINYLADAPWLRWSVIVLIIAALLAMGTHLFQSLRPYDFEERVQSPWFYKGNIPNLKKLKWYTRTKKNASDALDLDITHNKEKIVTENLANALEGDIKQLIKLYAILASKDNDADTTARVLELGLLVFIVMSGILYVVNLVVPLP